ncbi:MAG: GFA family protein [Proteobacteria bacterium]|nr:GFA family protein [Pseudomonadota bacterium]
MTNIQGGCACGAIRFALKAKPIVVHACHCTDCQRLTGSAFAINAWIEKDQVDLLSGAPASFKFTDPGRNNCVHFCAQCGCYVWTEYMPGFWFVRVGALDDPKAFAPDMHIWIRSKQPWLVLPEDVPVFEQYYDRKLIWPRASLARFAAVGEAWQRSIAP